MASKLGYISVLRLYSTRSFSAQAAAASKTVQSSSLPKQEAKTSTLPNGLVVTSLENYSPVARLAVVVKAGSRYENGSNLGITHALRNAAGLSTTNSRLFTVVRNLDHIGANLVASSTRDHIIYRVECHRDETATALKYLTEVIFQPAFKHWELTDVLPRLKFDLAFLKSHPEAVLLEALHKAAFRGGLSNSLFTPDFLIGKHSSQLLLQYVKEHITAPRAVLSAVGLDHDRLLHVLKPVTLSSSAGVDAPASKFGGGEVRIESNYPSTYFAISVEGASLKNQKELLTLALLQRIYGVGPRVPYSEGASTKLGQAAAKATSQPFAVNSININYADTGLFGVVIAGNPADMDKLVKSVITEMRNIGKNGLKDQDIQSAKTQLKSEILFARENNTTLAEEMALQISYLGETIPFSETEKNIDAITKQDVASVASKVIKAKPATAALGRLHNTPYLDDLL